MTMYDIKDISSLEELVKFDSIIREKARLMCNNNEIYDDITNDMYLLIDTKMKEGKIINGGYIFLTLKNLFTNYNKRQSKMDFGNELTQAYIKDVDDDFEDTKETKEYQETLYDEISRRIETLTWYEQKLLQMSKEMSLLELHRQSGISYRSLCYTKEKINNKMGIIKKKK